MTSLLNKPNRARRTITSAVALHLASQRGKGRVKGGAEEPKLLLGEGRGSGGVRGGGELEGAEERHIAPFRDLPGKVGVKQRTDPLGIQATVHPGLNLSSEAVKEGDEGVRTRVHFHSSEMVVVRGKGLCGRRLGSRV